MMHRAILNKGTRIALEGLTEKELKVFIHELGIREEKKGILEFIELLVTQYKELSVWWYPYFDLQQINRDLMKRGELYEKYIWLNEKLKYGESFDEALLQVSLWDKVELGEKRSFSSFWDFVVVFDENGTQKTYSDGTFENKANCSVSTLQRAFNAYFERDMKKTKSQKPKAKKIKTQKNKIQETTKKMESRKLGLEFYSLEELERFAFSVSVAFLNEELPSLLAGYVYSINEGKQPHRERKSVNRKLFMDIPNLEVCERKVKDCEKRYAWQQKLIRGRQELKKGRKREV